MQTIDTSPELRQLVSDVEELLSKLDREHTPSVRKLKKRVARALRAAQRGDSPNGRLHSARVAAARVGRAARTVDNYITDYPRLAFVTAAILAGAIGRLIGASGAARSSD